MYIVFSCGDGSLGEPPARGDGYQCGNMKQAGVETEGAVFFLFL